MPINITLEQAQEIWSERMNGRCDGTSPSKGGRAWLDGEFQLDELEALCVIIRHQAGDDAQGAEELVKSREESSSPQHVVLANYSSTRTAVIWSDADKEHSRSLKEAFLQEFDTYYPNVQREDLQLLKSLFTLYMDHILLYIERLSHFPICYCVNVTITDEKLSFKLGYENPSELIELSSIEVSYADRPIASRTRMDLDDRGRDMEISHINTVMVGALEKIKRYHTVSEEAMVIHFLPLIEVTKKLSQGFFGNLGFFDLSSWWQSFKGQPDDVLSLTLSHHGKSDKEMQVKIHFDVAGYQRLASASPTLHKEPR